MGASQHFNKITVIVLDSVGIGELPDAVKFGDKGSHTLGHILETVPGTKLPNMQKLGLGNIAPLPNLEPAEAPAGYYGKMAEISSGKDTMTGHWELMGIKTETPFQTYPSGFPRDLISRFEHETGRKVIGNKVASGTEILVELGEEHMKTGSWIVYTSADSVFQIAAHEDVVPLSELYKACEVARRLTLEPEHSVGRVIARPFVGQPGEFKRTPNRHDYAVTPPEPTVLNALKNAGKEVVAVGKINDIFSGEGVTASYPTKSNAHGIEETLRLIQEPFTGMLFTNLVDFDSLFGHRRDPEGYAGALEEFDAALPDLMDNLGENDLLVITADHGNDPTHAGTDHTREYVPILVYGKNLKTPGNLGVRGTYADLASTIADNFGVHGSDHGKSFLRELK
ncbi:phosphopentomutase [Fontibacillus panacisegetis]|uniref:Phosphopentomutase n=1 Tax=Fontibacillus panacisegetis TaxID=670482 RepID=A0A1G7SHD6_9BACL|nr:phosphopentomutase [Fontibacillus panacisegetis]SDG22413.1 phosphopentomutase [Fontibacillus panacisegetis]